MRHPLSAIRALAALIIAAPMIAGAPAAADDTPEPPGGGPTMLSTAFTPEALREGRLAEFEALLDRAAATEDFVALAVAVVSGGEVVFLKTYGVLETGAAAPVTADTVFRIASVSKGFASSLAALAVSEGRFDWSSPVAPYAPRFALNGGGERSVTIEHILSHRVGLPPNAYDNLLEAGIAASDILPRFRSVQPICRVGACYAYQNISYNLIGDILAAEYGAPYEDLVRERIFGPLGMRTASFGVEGLSANGNWARPQRRERISGQENAFTPWRTVEVKDAYYRVPAAGGVNASIRDMAAWLKAQMGYAPAVLSADALAALHRPVVRTLAETRRWRTLSRRITDTHYGLGWRIYDYAGHTLITHSGGVEGYGAQVAILPEQDVGIVVLANTRAERVWRIAPTFLDIELGLPMEDWLALESLPDYAGGEAGETFGGG